MFDHIINWNLKSGSHEFPGPDGGTCINEAAIVAAGFEYKSVGSASDCPPCFSRPIAAFAIRVNDAMPDELRNKLLMPFVTRLAGTADTPEVERRRYDYLIVQITKRLIAPGLWRQGYVTQSEAFAACATIEDVKKAALDVSIRALDLHRVLTLDFHHTLNRALSLDHALSLDLHRDLDLDRDRAEGALGLAVDRALSLGLDLDINPDHQWAEAVAILSEAIELGKQADPIDTAVIAQRFAAIRELAAAQ